MRQALPTSMDRVVIKGSSQAATAQGHRLRSIGGHVQIVKVKVKKAKYKTILCFSPRPNPGWNE